MSVVRNETISIMDFELIDSVAKSLSISSSEVNCMYMYVVIGLV